MTRPHLTVLDWRRIERAGAHAAPDHLLTPEARFCEGVTDVDVARFLEALEAGTRFRVDAQRRWRAPTGSPLPANISNVIREAIRTGLAYNVPSHALVPARVHSRKWDGAEWVTACDDPGENFGPKRVRLVSDDQYVDCPDCLDRL